VCTFGEEYWDAFVADLELALFLEKGLSDLITACLHSRNTLLFVLINELFNI
jgi:hypothetical protein